MTRTLLKFVGAGLLGSLSTLSLVYVGRALLAPATSPSSNGSDYSAPS